MPGRRVLGIAVASGRVGFVLMFRGRPCQWGLSRTAAESVADAKRIAGQWIARFRPDVVVTEKTTTRCRKGKKTKELIEAIASVAAEAELYDLAVPRPKPVPNKYAAAEALADRFPDLQPRLPDPRNLWDSEPRNITIFEAVALALVVVDREESPMPGDGR